MKFNGWSYHAILAADFKSKPLRADFPHGRAWRLLPICLSVIAATSLATGCVTRLFSGEASIDSRPIAVQTVSLFNQRSTAKGSNRSWKGDWVFRRDRLELIDQELRSVKPDLLIMQDLMERSKSPSESDRAILLAGALESYDWDSLVVRSWDDTGEDQSLGIAVDLPLRIVRDGKPGLQRTWMVGTDGFMVASQIEHEGQVVAVFNVHMPTQVGRSYLWYTFVQERIAATLKAYGGCSDRVIVAGFLPANMDAARFNEFLESLQLRDAGEGFCDVAAACYTATPVNEIFVRTNPDETPFRADRVLLPRSAQVTASGVDFNTSADPREYLELYGLRRLWPTERFGWKTSARFARCDGPSL